MSEDKAKQLEEVDNVISKEEFQSLEKKEGVKKKKQGSGIFHRDREKGKPTGKGSDVDELMMRAEKMDARMEMIENMRKGTDERISALSEEIGELRSALLEKEKTFGELEGKFRKLVDISDEIQPERIMKELEKRSDEIVKTQSRTEALETRMDDARKTIKELQSVTDNVKNINRVFALSEKLDKKIAKIDEERKNMSRMAGKTETVFSDINEKLRDFEKYRGKIEFNEESVYELMKTLDSFEVRLEKFVKKEKFDDVLKRIEDMKTEYEIRIDDMKEIVDRLLSDLKKGGIKKVLSKCGDEKLKEIQKALERLETEEKKGKEKKETVKAGKPSPPKVAVRPAPAPPKPVKMPPRPGPEPPPKPADMPPRPVPSGESKAAGEILNISNQIQKLIAEKRVQEAKKMYERMLSSYESLKGEMNLDDYVYVYHIIAQLDKKLV